jgi:hypothetical protein
MTSQRRAAGRPRGQVPDDAIADMLARRRMGQTLDQIAAAHGYQSRQGVRYLLGRYGVATAAEAETARNVRRRAIIQGALSGETPATDIDGPAVSRDAEILRARAAGVTLGEIGQRFGLTRERVRQIVDREDGPTAAQVRAQRAARSVQRGEELAALIHAAIRREGRTTAAEIADALGVETAAVLGAIRDDDAWHINLRRRRRKPYYDDESLLNSLRALSERLALKAAVDGVTRQPVSMSYWDAQRSPDVLPTAHRVAQRFGSWNQACQAAGIPAYPVSSVPVRWSDDEIVDWVRRFLSAAPVGARSLRAYTAWARRTPGAPSDGTVRTRLGSWIEAQLRAIQLGQDGGSDEA